MPCSSLTLLQFIYNVCLFADVNVYVAAFIISQAYSTMDSIPIIQQSMINMICNMPSTERRDEGHLLPVQDFDQSDELFYFHPVSAALLLAQS